MVNKKVIFAILAFVLVIVMVVAYWSFVKPPKAISAALKAISPKSALIIEIKNYPNWRKKLDQKTLFWPELIQGETFKTLNQKLLQADSLINSQSELKLMLSKKPLLISLNLIGKNQIEPLYVVETDLNTSEDAMLEHLTQSVNGKAQVAHKAYQGTEIYSLTWTGQNQNVWSYAFYKGLFLASPSVLLVEEAIRQIDLSQSILDDKAFVRVQSSAGEQTDMNLYVQYASFSRIFGQYIRPEWRAAFKNFEQLGRWTEFDVETEPSALVLNGFTSASDSSGHFLSIFKNQKSGKSHLDEILPTQTAMIWSCYLSDYTDFETRYVDYLKQNNTFETYEQWFYSFENTYQISLEKVFREVVENEIALVYSSIAPEDLSQNTFFVVQTTGQSQTLDAFEPMFAAMAKQKGVDPTALSVDYAVKDGKNIKIYSFPKSNLASAWMGRIYEHAQTNYFTFINDYMVFGNSLKDLKNFLDQNERKNVLENDSYFADLQSEYIQDHNLCLYANVNLSKPLIEYGLVPEISKYVISDFDQIKKFQALVFQMNYNEDLLYTNMVLKYNPVVKERPRALWESKLDTLLSIKPKIVTNHLTQEKEIMVQDINHTLYLINKSGKILWRQPIGQKIESDIVQIDLFKNEKFQYVFNTKDRIFVLDRNGNNVEHFPISLRANATAGVSVFDYDGSRDYRFFIPCKDRKIYAYDSQGNVLPGWAFGVTEAEVSMPVQYFRVIDSDYILFADKNRVYMVNRKGEEKIKLDHPVQKSINNAFYLVQFNQTNYFASTKPNGELFLIDVQGHVLSKDGIDADANHYITIADINQNQVPDVIYTNENALTIWYDFNKSKTIEVEGQLSPPVTFAFSANNYKIGLTDYEHNDLYLFDADGSMYKDFPLKGATLFSITLLNNPTDPFNLIAGSRDGFIFNYQIP